MTQHIFYVRSEEDGTKIILAKVDGETGEEIASIPFEEYEELYDSLVDCQTAITQNLL